MLDNLKFKTHAQYTELKADRDALLEKSKQLEQQFINLQNMSVDLVEKQAQHDQTVADLKATHETNVSEIKAGYEKQISDLTAIAEIEKTSSEAKAISVLATIGIPADEVPKVGAAHSPLEHLKTLSGKARSEYYKQHRASILKAASNVATT